MARDRNASKVPYLVVAVLGLCAAAWFAWGGGKDDGGSSDLAPSTGSPFAVPSSDKAPTVRRGEAERPDPEVNSGGETETVAPPPAPILAKDPFGIGWSAIEGAVVDRYGAAVAGARLRLYTSAMMGRAAEPPLQEFVTTDDGLFRFDEVVAGEPHALRVEHSDFQTWRHTGVVVAEGKTLHLDIRLLDGLTVSGRVVHDDDGSPVAGAVVRVYDLDELVVRPEDALEREVVTAPDGNFELTAVLPGSKRITADAEGLGNRTVPFVRLNAATARRPLEFRLKSGGSVQGRVLDREGGGIVGATVTVQSVQGASEETEGMFLRSAMTQSDGSFRVDGLIDGLYVLRAGKLGYAGGRITLPPHLASILLGSEDAPGLSNRNVRPGDRDLYLFLEPAPTLTGRVVDDQTGRPVTAFCLQAMPNKGRGVGTDASFERFVDDAGRFEYAVDLSRGLSGDWGLYVTAPGYAGAKMPLSLFEFRDGLTAPKLRIPEVEVRLSRGASIFGRLVTRGGTPVEGAVVR
ncbi:MAG: carboxypeptidase regulatory-like domain-containing protein, partial [Planctomycetes bacterium]|nr:carboxypeptidase regulatory-like domain-containing protein [Planctomycetota bacterium]